MRLQFDHLKLHTRELWARVGILLALAFGAFALRLIQPETLSWLPLRASCGAATGLPCIFCGTTRALHHLLNGDFARALYFNWLAFPVAALLLAICVKLALEVVTARRVLLPIPRLRLTRRSVFAGAGAIVALWILQVTLAVGLHKEELLNPQGVLYAFLLK